MRAGHMAHSEHLPRMNVILWFIPSTSEKRRRRRRRKKERKHWLNSATVEAASGTGINAVDSMLVVSLVLGCSTGIRRQKKRMKH